MKERKAEAASIDLNDAVRGKPYLDIDRVIHHSENPKHDPEKQLEESIKQSVSKTE